MSTLRRHFVPAWRAGLAILVAVGLLVISAPAGRDAAADEKVLRVAVYGEPLHLNPAHQRGDLAGDHVMWNLFDPLFRWDFDKSELVPELAKGVTLESPTSWVIEVRPGIQWHKGYGELTAEDVAFTVNHIIKDNTPMKFLFAAVKGAEVVDKYRVRIQLERPFTPALVTGFAGLGGRVISKKAFTEMGPDKYRRNPIGTGPFEFEEWVSGDHITIKKFKDYWDKGYPLLDKVIWTFVPDATVKQNLLRTGAVHLIDRPEYKDLARLKQDPVLTVQQVPGWNWDYFTFGHLEKPFDKKAFRQAIAYAIDRQQIADAVYFGAAYPAIGPQPRGYQFFDASLQKYPFKADLDKAKALLAEAGYPNGYPTPLNIITSDKPNLRRETEIVAEQLKKIGIRLNLQFHDMATFDKAQRVISKPGEIDAHLEDITIMAPDVHTSVYWFHRTKAGTLVRSYSNPPLDNLLDSGAQLFKPEERKGAYREAMKTIIDEAWYIYTVHVAQVRVMRKEVQHFKTSPDDMEIWLKYVDLGRQ